MGGGNAREPGGEGGPRRKVLVWSAGVLAAVIAGALSGGLSSAWDAIAGDDEPVRVTTDPVAAGRYAGISSSYLFTRPAASLGRPPRDRWDVDAWERWARRNGGVDATSTSVRAVVEGSSMNAVTLLGLEIRVLERRPPPKGVVVGGRGAGPVAVRYFKVDLDRSPPLVTASVGDEPAPGERAIDFPYRVSSGDPEVFLIIADAKRCDC